MKRTVAAVVLLLASTALGRPPRLQGEPQGAKQDVKEAGHDTKQAAKKAGTAVGKTAKTATHESAEAGKKTGTAVEKTTQKGLHKSAHAVKKGAGKVEGKTAP